jgi:hypothetical protein
MEAAAPSLFIESYIQQSQMSVFADLAHEADVEAAFGYFWQVWKVHTWACGEATGARDEASTSRSLSEGWARGTSLRSRAWMLMIPPCRYSLKRLSPVSNCIKGPAKRSI